MNSRYWSGWGWDQVCRENVVIPGAWNSSNISYIGNMSVHGSRGQSRIERQWVQCDKKSGVAFVPKLEPWMTETQQTLVVAFRFLSVAGFVWLVAFWLASSIKGVGKMVLGQFKKVAHTMPDR
jgi:hypothetical protein